MIYMVCSIAFWRLYQFPVEYIVLGLRPQTIYYSLEIGIIFKKLKNILSVFAAQGAKVTGPGYFAHCTKRTTSISVCSSAVQCTELQITNKTQITRLPFLNKIKKWHRITENVAEVAGKIFSLITNRPGVAGAVLQTPFWLIHWFIKSVRICENIFNTPSNHRS